MSNLVYLDSTPAGGNTLDGYPLTELGYTGLSEDNSDGTDISFEELGFNHDELFANHPGLKVAAFSANRGAANEYALITVQTQGAHTYVGVIGANGAFSLSPYRLQVETSTPMDLAAAATEGGAYTPLVPVAGAPYEYKPGSVSSPETLFVTQADRLAALYGEDGWTRIRSALEVGVLEIPSFWAKSCPFPFSRPTTTTTIPTPPGSTWRTSCHTRFETPSKRDL